MSPFEDLLTNPQIVSKTIDDRRTRWAIRLIIFAVVVAVLAGAMEMLIAQHVIGAIMQQIFNHLTHSTIHSSH